MTWTTLTFGYASLLTSAKMTQLQDNFTALATGDASAPRVSWAAIGSHAIPASGSGYYVLNYRDRVVVDSGALYPIEIIASGYGHVEMTIWTGSSPDNGAIRVNSQLTDAGTFALTSAGTSHVFSLSVAPCDLIQLYIYTSADQNTAVGPVSIKSTVPIPFSLMNIGGRGGY